MKVVLSNIASGPFQLGNTDSKCKAAWREAGDKKPARCKAAILWGGGDQDLGLVLIGAPTTE